MEGIVAVIVGIGERESVKIMVGDDEKVGKRVKEGAEAEL